MDVDLGLCIDALSKVSHKLLDFPMEVPFAKMKMALPSQRCDSRHAARSLPKTLLPETWYIILIVASFLFG